MTTVYAVYGKKTASKLCSPEEMLTARQRVERELKTRTLRHDQSRRSVRETMIKAFLKKPNDPEWLIALTIWLAHGQLGSAIEAVEWFGYEVIDDPGLGRSHTFRLMAGFVDAWGIGAPKPFPGIKTGPAAMLG